MSDKERPDFSVETENAHYIMNCLNEEVRAQAFGRWFSWKPLQIKAIQNRDLYNFLVEKRGEDGLVGFPADAMNLDKNSAQFNEIWEEKRKEGVAMVIRKLEWIQRNLEQSLRYDLETKNIKGDPLAYASAGEVAAYKKLAALKGFERANSLNKADEIRRIKSEIEGEDGNTGSTVSGTNSTRRTDTSKPTKA